MCACKHVKVSIYVEVFWGGDSNCVAIIEYSFYIPFFLLLCLFNGAYTYKKKNYLEFVMCIFPRVAPKQEKDA